MKNELSQYQKLIATQDMEKLCDVIKIDAFNFIVPIIGVATLAENLIQDCMNTRERVIESAHVFVSKIQRTKQEILDGKYSVEECIDLPNVFMQWEERKKFIKAKEAVEAVSAEFIDKYVNLGLNNKPIN